MTLSQDMTDNVLCEYYSWYGYVYQCIVIPVAIFEEQFFYCLVYHSLSTLVLMFISL